MHELQVVYCADAVSDMCGYVLLWHVQLKAYWRLEPKMVRDDPKSPRQNIQCLRIHTSCCTPPIDCMGRHACMCATCVSACMSTNRSSLDGTMGIQPA